MYLIKHIKGKNIYYVEISDKINHLEIIGFLEIIYENVDRSIELKLITDYRKAIIDETTVEPIEKIGYFINSKLKTKYSNIRWASISNSHLPTTGAMLLHDLIKGPGIAYEPFTTIEKSLDWMNLTFDTMSMFQFLNKAY
jgi:hypothetical protein